MRITLVTHYFPAHRGGIELVAAEIARHLAARHRAQIAWHASDCDPPPSIPGVVAVPARSWNAIERRIGVPYPIWSPGALWRVGQAARAADVVHLHDCLYLPNLLTYAAARLAGRPVIVTQHVGMIPYRSPLLRALLTMAYRILGRIVLGGASQVVFVSDSVRRYFSGFVRFKAPPLLVANGVDTSVFHPLDEERRAALRLQLGVEGDTPLLLFVGRFVEKKGMPALRQLAERLPQARWMFAGWGPLDPGNWALSNVTVFRDRSGAQLAQLYQAADLLVLPSVGEGFPLVVQEAMACGTPALVGIETAAGSPDAADVLPAEDTGGPDALPRWEQRIRKLTAAANRGALRHKVAAYAAANWSWERCAERYAELLRRFSPQGTRVPEAVLAPRAGDYWTRWLVVASLVVGALSVIVVLDYGGYPYEPYRYWILEYLIRTQDLSGAVLLVLLVLAAYFSPARPAVLGWVDAISRHPWRVAAVAFLALCLGTLYVEHNTPLAQDEYAALFQSRAFASGHLTGLFPPELVGRLIPPFYLNQFLYGSLQTGQVAAAYWPGFALILAPFSFINAPWACNPLLASLALVLMARLAVRLTGAPQAGGWAILLALGSPGFTGMAITYFSMTAHLLLNLVFAWLLFERSTVRLILAGIVGSIAILLHNPLPHFLFALPWIAWLALRPDRWRTLLPLAAGYAPLALGVGFGWALLLSQIQGNALSGYFPFDDNPYHRVANFFWDWHVKMRTALPGPRDTVLATRMAELVRLWNWAVPGLPVLALAGWWIGGRNARLQLLALSFVSTFLGYMAIGFTQGNGWGARYLHPAWGTLPILGAAALVLAANTEVRLRVYVASLALLSLVFATLLRATQIDSYLEMHLANRPPAVPGARQIVFVAFDRPNFTADLIQNDPLLRDDVWYMFSYGGAADRAFLASRFPGARMFSEDRRGQVWLLDPAIPRPSRSDRRAP